MTFGTLYGVGVFDRRGMDAAAPIVYTHRLGAATVLRYHSSDAVESTGVRTGTQVLPRGFIYRIEIGGAAGGGTFLPDGISMQGSGGRGATVTVYFDGRRDQDRHIQFTLGGQGHWGGPISERHYTIGRGFGSGGDSLGNGGGGGGSSAFSIGRQHGPSLTGSTAAVVAGGGGGAAYFGPSATVDPRSFVGGSGVSQVFDNFTAQGGGIFHPALGRIAGGGNDNGSGRGRGYNGNGVNDGGHAGTNGRDGRGALGHRYAGGGGGGFGGGASGLGSGVQPHQGGGVVTAGAAGGSGMFHGYFYHFPAQLPTNVLGVRPPQFSEHAHNNGFIRITQFPVVPIPTQHLHFSMHGGDPINPFPFAQGFAPGEAGRPATVTHPRGLAFSHWGTHQNAPNTAGTNPGAFDFTVARSSDVTAHAVWHRHAIPPPQIRYSNGSIYWDTWWAGLPTITTPNAGNNLTGEEQRTAINAAGPNRLTVVLTRSDGTVREHQIISGGSVAIDALGLSNARYEIRLRANVAADHLWFLPSAAGNMLVRLGQPGV